MATEVMDESRKRRIGICSFLPLAAFLLATGYHLKVFRTQVSGKDMKDHVALATETYRHFTPLAIVYGMASMISLAVLLFFIVHLLRLKQMAPGAKLFTAVMLTMFMPISFPIFWYLKIRKEPCRLEVYPDL